MRKVSLLLSTLGGAMAGYLFSNKKLRDELSNAKDAEAAAKTLGKHLQHDGKMLARQAQQFIESEDVQANLTKAKGFAKGKFDEAKDELNRLMGAGSKSAKTAARRATKSVTAKASVVAKQARSAAKRVSRRVQTRSRKVS